MHATILFVKHFKLLAKPKTTIECIHKTFLKNNYNGNISLVKKNEIIAGFYCFSETFTSGFINNFRFSIFKGYLSQEFFK